MALTANTFTNGGFQRGGVDVVPHTGGIVPPRIEQPVPDSKLESGNVKTLPEPSPNTPATGDCQLCGMIQDWVKKNPIFAAVIGFFILRILLK
jgi:hypothetical protein